MTITFLGTGTSQGVPVIACTCEVCQSIDFRDKRTRTSIWVEAADRSIVFDSGPDFRTQMLRERVQRLDALVFTHAHKDHTAGMDDVRSFNFKQKMSIPIYAETRVIEQLKQEFAYVFADHKYPGVPQITPVEINENPFEIGDVSLQPIRVMHYKLPVLGFRMGDFSYITDANAISDKEKAKIKDTKILVLNALQKEPHISHFTLDEAIALAEEKGDEKTYFTHMSHRLGRQRDVEKELPEGMYFAYDGLKISL